MPVCHAIQHAHQKGIIHRDIKPSNVLIALYDDRPVPKVIDFGVAKATGQQLTELTLHTGFGAVVGTFEYMSPEQASFNQLDVDTRSDIYSLGVLLYELLTGSPPFTKKELEMAGMVEMLRVIREQEPSKPSTKLSAAAGLPTLAANRGTEPAKLARLVRGELDWIVMKALEKDRGRRYETANGFAMDVQRYLVDEAVQACPPSIRYRLRKFLRRNKGPVLAASLVVVALIGGIVGTTVGLVRAEQERKDAVAAKEAEAEQRRVADEERAVAQAVNDFLRQDLLLQANSYEQANRGFAADPSLSVKEALNRAAARIGDRFRDQPLVEAAIRQSIGETYIGIGDYPPSLPQFERALALRTEKLGSEHLLTLSSKDGLATAYLYLDRPAEALMPYEETVRSRRENLGAAHPDTLESAIGLALCYRGLNRQTDAVSLLEETLKLAKANLDVDHVLTIRCLGLLALSYRLANRLSESITMQEEALKLSKSKRGPRHPATLVAMGLLAMAYESTGRFAEAVSLFEETLRFMKEHLNPDHPHSLTTMWGLTKSYRGAGRLAKAVANQEETVKLCQAKLGPRDSFTLIQTALMAALHMERGRHDLAEPLLRQNLAILAKDSPDEWEMFEAKSMLGAALMGLKMYADAEPLLLAGYEGMKKRESKQLPEDRDLRLREALTWLIQFYVTSGRPDDAAKWRKELEALKRVAEIVKPKNK